MPGRSCRTRTVCALASLLLAVPPASASAQSPPADRFMPINVCVIQAGNLTTVPVLYDRTTGDSLDNSRMADSLDNRTPFNVAYPTDASYAAGATWFINGDKVTTFQKPYAKYGLPRVLGTTDVVKRGTFRGVPIFVEAGTKTTTVPEVIYVPVRPGCEFQPYQIEIPRRPSD